MGKNKTGIRGLTERWRTRKNYDVYQVGITTVRPTKWISPKDHATAKHLDLLIKSRKLREKTAASDNDFQTLRHRLLQELAHENALRSYKIQERLNLKTKQFNFQNSIKQLVDFKMDTSVSCKHESILLTFWLPFFQSKGCEHPRDFKNWRKQAIMHIRTAKKIDSDEKYSVNTWTTLASSFNEYMKFLIFRMVVVETLNKQWVCLPAVIEFLLYVDQITQTLPKKYKLSY